MKFHLIVTLNCNNIVLKNENGKAAKKQLIKFNKSLTRAAFIAGLPRARETRAWAELHS